MTPQEAAERFIDIAERYFAEARGSKHRHPPTETEIHLRDSLWCAHSELWPYVDVLPSAWSDIKVALGKVEAQFKKPPALWADLAELAHDACKPLQGWLDKGCQYQVVSPAPKTKLDKLVLQLAENDSKTRVDVEPKVKKELSKIPLDERRHYIETHLLLKNLPYPLRVSVCGVSKSHYYRLPR